MAESIPITTPTFNFSVEAYHKLAETGIMKPTDRVELISGWKTFPTINQDYLLKLI